MTSSIALAVTGVLINRWIIRSTAEQNAYRKLTQTLGSARGEPDARERYPQLIALAAKLAGFKTTFRCDKTTCPAVNELLLEVRHLPCDAGGPDVSSAVGGPLWARMPCSTLKSNWSSAGCDTARSSSRGVSPVCVKRDDANEEIPVLGAAAAENTLKERVLLLAKISEWIRGKLIGAQLYEESPELSWAPVAAFFITPEGFVRVWRPDGGESPDSELLSDPARDFRGQKYVDRYLEVFSKVTGNETAGALGDLEPYLDVDKNGLVGTRYGPVYDIRNQFVGVVAVDYRLPRIDGTDVGAGINRNARQEYEPVVEADVCDLNAPQSAWSVEDQALGQMPMPSNSEADVQTHGDLMFATVPLSRSRFMRLRVKQPSTGEPFFTMLGSIVGSLVFVGRVIAGRRRLLKLDEESAVLRKLQSGVLRTHGADLVVEANERAEELFDRTFPSIGTGEDGVGVSFRALIIRAVRKTSEWRSGTVAEPDSVHAHMFAEYWSHELRHDRENGVSTDYYILLKGVAELPEHDPTGGPGDREDEEIWLHMSAAPMHNPSTGFEIFGVVNRPSRERRAQLMAFRRAGG